MSTFEATITSKGQVTVPASLRALLGLKSGDKLVFRHDADGAIRVTARSSSLGDLLGIIGKGPAPVDGEQVADWIAQSRGSRWRSDRS